MARVSLWKCTGIIEPLNAVWRPSRSSTSARTATSPLHLHCDTLQLFMSTTRRGHVGLFKFLACSLFAIASCCVGDRSRVSPLLAVWAVGTGLRWYFDDHQLALDNVIFGIADFYAEREGLKRVVTQRWDASSLSIVARLIVPLAVPLIAIGLFVRWHTPGKDIESRILPECCTEWALPYPKARIFPCQTKHARMFPKRHSFEYSYLQCGFPIVPAGVTSDGTEIGLGKDISLGSWWLRVRAEDYLERGNGALGFYGKLQIYLRAQVMDPSGPCNLLCVTDDGSIRKTASGRTLIL